MSSLEAAIRRAVLAAVLLTCTACSGSSSTPAPTGPPSASPSASAAAEPTSTASPTPAPSPTPTGVQALPFCATAQLRLTVEEADSGAGQFHQRLVLTNTDVSCTLHGYPGVSFVDVGGRQLGSPAAQSEGTVRRQTLAKGGSVVAVLTYSNAEAYPDSSCRPRRASSVKVYPPGQKEALLAFDPIIVCTVTGSGQLHIGPIETS